VQRINFTLAMEGFAMNEEWVTLPTLLSLAQAHTNGWEIETELFPCTWVPWLGITWGNDTGYRGRPKQPVERIIASKCWYDNLDGSLTWRDSVFDIGCDRFKRFPAGDITGEIEE
jgi:hypothetical protein